MPQTPPVGFRKEQFLKTPIIYGKKIELKIPTGEQHQGQFAIVELNDILASHNEKTYQSTQGYPVDANGENVNDRNYTNDTGAQARIREFAENLEADRLIITARTPAGTPIITVDGIVVSGNNRTMSLKLAVTDFPEKYEEYKRFLLDEAESFGFKRIDIVGAIMGENIIDERDRGETFRDNKYISFRHPVLVRFDYDFPAYNALELSKFNKDTKKAERPIDKAIKLGKILESSDRCTKIITDIVGRYETFSEFYANLADQKLLKDTLLECNILTSQELPAFWQERTFTEQGKELIENLLAGLVLSKNALIATNDGGAKIYRQTIITCLPVLSANKALGEQSLNAYLNEAVIMQSQMAAAKLGFADFVAQSNMFEGTKESKWGMYLNRLLAAGRNTFKKSIEAYNDSVLQNEGESLFGEKPTQAEIFAAHIVSKIDPAMQKLIDTMGIDNAVAGQTTAPSALSPEPLTKDQIQANLAQMASEASSADKFVQLLSSGLGINWGVDINDPKILSVFNGLPNNEPHNIRQLKNFYTAEGMPLKRQRKALQPELEKEWQEIKSEMALSQIMKQASEASAEMDERIQEYDNLKFNNQNSKSAGMNPFVDKNFFLENPDKILALQQPGISRWKKPIIEYTGDLDLDRIDAPLDFISVELPAQPTVSVVTESVFNSAPHNPDIASNIVKALKQSPADVAVKRKRASKQQEPVTDQTPQERKNLESYTVREVFDMINPEVSVDELRAFMWYKHQQGRTIKSQAWLDLTGLTNTELYNSPERVRLWVENGLLYYFDGNLIPAYLYLAENVYDKKNRLTTAAENGNSGQDIEYIRTTYGETVLINQIEALNKVFAQQYEKRLLISGAGNTSGLVITPVSKFAHDIKIQTLADGMDMRWKAITASKNKYFGKPDFLAVGVTDRDKKTFPELSLTDAFCYWLRTDDTISFKKGVSYADIIKVYIQAKSKPATEAMPGSDGQYHGKELEKKKMEDAGWARLQAKVIEEGNRLFLEFMATQLTLNDKVLVETKWNQQFNGYVPINYNKVPVAFRCNRYDMGKPMEIKPEKREAVAMFISENSGGICYDVGVGKTPSAIFTISQMLEIGWAIRPFMVVPNQTYKQWIAEFKKFCAHIPINEFYNLSADFINDWKDMQGKTKQVPEGTVSIMTYEAMQQIGLEEETINTFRSDVTDILMQKHKDPAALSSKKRDREAEKLASEVEQLIGKALSKTRVTVEEFGWDFIGFDEAHALKKVFTTVQGEKEPDLNTEANTKTVSRYKINSGSPSYSGVKAFVLTQYFQRFHGGNTLLLTATPFTNSPLEIYSMLSLVAYNRLRDIGLDNLQTFFENYIDVSYEMVINSRLKPERKQVILGFTNLISLQTLIRRFLNYKTGEQVNVPRPNKIVLPLRTKMINGTLVQLSESEKVETFLPLSADQARLMEAVKRYADDEISEDQMCAGHLEEGEENEDAIQSEGIELDEEFLGSDEKKGVRLLKAMNHARNLALSPYIFDCSGLGEPNYKEYIATSNKLLFVMEAIKSVKAHHAKKGTPMSGQIIYMDRGVEYFPLIRDYLIKELGFAEHEVGIISSKRMEPTPKSMAKEDKKEYLKNLFLGKRFNPVTLEMEEISHDERMKVIIGSSVIKEGMNLQTYTSTLYDCWEDWNPTDVQQIEGRFWRQGNQFKSVRMVHPLMIDSMDIFMFQKLEEKTSRINTIWESDGRTNVLKTEEFNPRDLKYSLIRDPRVLAQMELQELGEKIEEDINDLQNQIKRNNSIIAWKETVHSYEKNVPEWLHQYRPYTENPTGGINTKGRSLETAVSLMQEVIRKQTDAQGKVMAYDYQKDKKKPSDFYSRLAPATKPYWFDELVYAFRNLKRAEKEYLAPKGLTISGLDDYNKNIEKQIGLLTLEKGKLTDDKAITAKANEIIEYREANKITERTVPEVVAQFARLNYLLDELKVPNIEISAKMQVPLVDENNLARIDAEALAILDEALVHEPETKRMHTIEIKDGDTVRYEYTPERKKLHKEILAELTEHTVCVEQGQPIAILTGGAPGSGKSTFLHKYAPYMESDLIYKIDADEIRARLPEYKGWNAATTHQEARDLTEMLLDSFDRPCKHDVLYDGTMTNAKKYIPLVRRFKELGYKVFIAFMDVPKEVSIKRAMNRFRDNKGGSTKFGRYVPMFVIDEFFRTGKAGFEDLKKAVDGYMLIDSLTMEVKERGGENIPDNRDYKAMFNGPHPTAGQMAGEESEAEQIQFAIDEIKDMLKELKGKEKKEAKEAVGFLMEMLEPATV